MYNIYKRLGYSDFDINGDVSIFSIMNMLQDISSYFCEDNQIGEAYLKENNLGWIVFNWNIRFLKKPNVYETDLLNIATIVYDMKGAVTSRYYEIKDRKGEVLIKAYATWVLINSSTGHPTRLNDSIKNSIYPDLQNIELNYKIEKPMFSENGSSESVKDMTVGYSFLDVRGHMNNARYLDCVAEFIRLKELKCLYINYQVPLLFRERFTIRELKEENLVYLAFFNEKNDSANCVIKAEY